MKMNAKEEFLKAIDKKPDVLCAQIDILSLHTFAVDKVLELPVGYTLEQYNQFLEDLDFHYDGGYGIQQLEGTIWMINGEWIERDEYDGSEWWSYKKCPLIPGNLNYLNC